jgi:hypothetical protein
MRIAYLKGDGEEQEASERPMPDLQLAPPFPVLPHGSPLQQQHRMKPGGKACHASQSQARMQRLEGLSWTAPSGWLQGHALYGNCCCCH